MADEWKPQVVQQGDHVRKLAFRAGVSPDEVWGHDKNKELVARRKSMDLLCPGDVLHLPSSPRAGLDLSASTTNKYRATVPTVAVRLKLSDSEQTWSNEPFLVHGLEGTEPLAGTTGPEGEVAFEVPVHVREVTLSLRDGFCIVPLRIGDLDPAEEPNGALQRLRALRYLPDGECDDAMVASALRRLREDHGLPAEGGLDAAALDILVAAHLS